MNRRKKWWLSLVKKDSQPICKSYKSGGQPVCRETQKGPLKATKVVLLVRFHELQKLTDRQQLQVKLRWNDWWLFFISAIEQTRQIANNLSRHCIPRRFFQKAANATKSLVKWLLHSITEIQCLQLESLAQSSLEPAEHQYFPAPRVHVAVDDQFGRPLLQRGKSLKKTTEVLRFEAVLCHRQDREVVKISGCTLYCTIREIVCKTFVTLMNVESYQTFADKRHHLWRSSEKYSSLQRIPSLDVCAAEFDLDQCYWGAAWIWELVNWKTYFNIRKARSRGTRLYMPLCQETEISNVFFCDQCLTFVAWMGFCY